MIDRSKLMQWVVEAIRDNNGSATIVQICKHVWSNHENDLRNSGDGFYTWQYDIRWAGQKLRNEGKLMSAHQTSKGVWVLVK